jgi:ketosteroid isomerase-like protein
MGKVEEFALARSHRPDEIPHLLNVLGSSITHDHHVSVESVIADRSRAAIEIYTRGTTPDGRTYDHRATFQLEVSGGQITARREYVDTHHLKWITQTSAEYLALARSH